MKRRKILIILIMIILLLPLGITFSRYVTENIKNYLMEANNFFFNSDKLVSGGITYGINNWGGASNIEIQFELNNHKNNILTSDADISYTLTTTCDNTLILCNLNSNSGVIQVAEKTDNFTLTIIPVRAFADNESITATVTASSSSPYEKTLSATFVVTVGRRGVDYQITDSVGSPYLIFTVTNALDTYKVITPFGDYTAGHLLTIDEYLALSSADKAKCASVVITLSFDPSVIIIDTTSDIVASSTTQTTAYQGVNYISSITFPMDMMMSQEVRFYKRNSSIDYTYPIVNNTPVISFTAS
ncbi:MAG: hypothetical protein IJK67_00925 [Bacilli bacterium]|nr:hypothetical protein [Bacilli bacterium]